MILRVLKEMLGTRPAALPLQMPAEPSPKFVRDQNIPSVLALTHSYKGNGAAEMLMFVLAWLARDLGWQVNALSSGLPEADKETLVKVGIGLVEAIDPRQYDFAIANTVVSGLSHVEHFGPHLPCVLWVHEAETVLWNAQLPVNRMKQIFSMAKHIVFQSRWQAERIFGSFISSLPESMYSVIPNCLPTMPTTDGFSIGKPPGKKRIVFIGGVYERKRPADLVEAVIRLGRSDVECVFVGTTDHIHSLPPGIHSLLENDLRFRLTGEVGRTEAAAYLASADVLSLPSGDESQPLVLLEAAHFNVPVVISDLPVYRDFWVDGENCLKHAVGDIDGLATHLKTSLEGEAPAPAILGKIDVTAGVFRDRFEQVLRSLLPVGQTGRSSGMRA